MLENKTMQMSQQKIINQNHFQKPSKPAILILLHFTLFAIHGYYIFYAIEVFGNLSWPSLLVLFFQWYYFLIKVYTLLLQGIICT